jgi:hypothetical protein
LCRLAAGTRADIADATAACTVVHQPPAWSLLAAVLFVELIDEVLPTPTSHPAS